MRFTPEFEVKCSFDPLGTVSRDDPYLENVLRVRDRRLEVKNTAGRPRVVAQGTYVKHAEAYAAWGAPGCGEKVGPLTEEIVRKHYLGPFLEANYVQTFQPEPDQISQLRIQEVKTTYVLFRVNPRFWSGVRSARAVRAAIVDTETGTRSPSPVFSAHAKKPKLRWLAANVTRTGFSVRSFSAREDELTNPRNQPAPATLTIVDQEQGILLVEWKLPSDGLFFRNCPGPPGLEPASEPSRAGLPADLDEPKARLEAQARDDRLLRAGRSEYRPAPV